MLIFTSFYILMCMLYCCVCCPCQLTAIFFLVLAANFVALAWNVILSFKAHKEVIAK